MGLWAFCKGRDRSEEKFEVEREDEMERSCRVANEPGCKQVYFSLRIDAVTVLVRTGHHQFFRTYKENACFLFLTRLFILFVKLQFAQKS